MNSPAATGSALRRTKIREDDSGKADHDEENDQMSFRAERGISGRQKWWRRFLLPLVAEMTSFICRGVINPLQGISPFGHRFETGGMASIPHFGSRE